MIVICQPVSSQKKTLPKFNLEPKIYDIPQKWQFEDDVPFPKVGYVSSLEGMVSKFGIPKFQGAVPLDNLRSEESSSQLQAFEALMEAHRMEALNPGTSTTGGFF